MISLTEENYIKAIFTFCSQGNGEVNVQDLARHLGVKMPTATVMVKKLHAKGYVDYESYKPIKITKKGELAAGLVLRKHRLTEMFLSQSMGFTWDQVHDIAEQIEHIKSPVFFDKMDELLQHPTIDLYGLPIPNRKGEMEMPSKLKLSACKIADEVVCVSFLNSDTDFLKYLDTHGLKLGLKIKILDIENYDQSMQLFFEGKTLTISAALSENILVK